MRVASLLVASIMRVALLLLTSAGAFIAPSSRLAHTPT